MRVVDVDYRGRETTSGVDSRKMSNGLRKYLRNMESSIFRLRWNRRFYFISLPYFGGSSTPPGCEAGPNGWNLPVG